jgi:hypothetical protein
MRVGGRSRCRPACSISWKPAVSGCLPGKSLSLDPPLFLQSCSLLSGARLTVLTVRCSRRQVQRDLRLDVGAG